MCVCVCGDKREKAQMRERFKAKKLIVFIYLNNKLLNIN